MGSRSLTRAKNLFRTTVTNPFLNINGSNVQAHSRSAELYRKLQNENIAELFKSKITTTPRLHCKWTHNEICIHARNMGTTEKSAAENEISNKENNNFVTIDRSGLRNAPESEKTESASDKNESPLLKHLKAIIQFRNGPITVAEYMEEVLTNPIAGYYINRDVFGTAGDFVTSPEISQMFGEMIGIWCVATWQQMGSPKKLQLVELGPGRGTLMADLLRATAKFREFSMALKVHLVEVSPALRKIQWRSLKCTSSSGGDVPAGDNESPLEGVSRFSGSTVDWHLDLDSVPSGTPTLVIAHEFLDALPVHQFQKTEKGWREKLIDVAESSSPLPLRFVLAPHPTPASALLLPRRLSWMLPSSPENSASSEATAVPSPSSPTESGNTVDPLENVQQLEVCPLGLSLAVKLAKRVATDGGAALVVDYGVSSGHVEDSLQAIREHKFVHVLDSPGSADLSAHVDFPAISRVVQEENCGASCHGPIAQNRFLWSLGINQRLEALMRSASESEAVDLRRGYLRLMAEGRIAGDFGEDSGDKGSDKGRIEGMGLQYKVMVISEEGIGVPVGFS